MKKFVALLGLLGLATELTANPCISCVRKVQAVKVVKQVVVKNRVIAVQTPVVVVPTYSAVFLPPPPILVQQGSTAVAQQSVSYTQAQQQLTYGVQAVQAAPAQAVQAPDNLAMVLARIDKRLANLEEKCAIAPTAPAAPGPFEAVKTPGVPRAFGKCIVCHTATAAERDGGGFVMFDKGALQPFSERDLRLIVTKTSTGAMPPEKNAKGIQALTDEELTEIVQWTADRK